MVQSVAQQVETLRQQIREHDRKYYVLAAPEISDLEYDQLMQQLEQLEHEHPDLISTPVRSRNWGPPLSHAAILGKLDMVETLMRLEPADVEHGLGRLCVLGPLIRPTIQYSNR